MTRDEADELAADLERAGVYVQVEAIEPREPPTYHAGQDEWQLRCWRAEPAHFFRIVDAEG